LLTIQGLINDLGGSVIAAYDNTGEVIAVACADTQIIMLFSTSAIDSVSAACLVQSHLLEPPCAQAESVQGPFFHGRLDDPILATISQPPPKPVFTSISFSNNGHYILLGTSSDVHYVLDAYAETVLILRRLVGHRGFEYDRYGNKDVAPRRGAGGEEVGWTGDSKWVVSGSSDGSIVAWDLSPPPGQEKLLPTPDNTLRPTTTLRAADATGGPSRAVRANPRYAMLAVGGDNLVGASSTGTE
jgi:COMPASS component SWD2